MRRCQLLLLAAAVLAAPVLANPLLDGIPEAAFGTEGVAIADFAMSGNADDLTRGLAVAPGGKIYLAATVHLSTQSGTQSRFGLARFDAAGRLDPSFSGDGLAMPQANVLAGMDMRANSLFVRSDGKPVVVGAYLPAPGLFKILVCRYAVAGNLDPSYDGDGCTQPTLALIDQGTEFARVGLALPDDRVLLGGHADVDPVNPGRQDGVVLMLAANGAIDPSFGTQGYTRLSPPGGTSTGINDLVRLGDGRLLVFGTSNMGRYVARLQSNGALDAGFGVGGYRLLNFLDLHSLPQPLDFTVAGAVDADGRIYHCGHVRYENSASKSVIAIARLTPNGALDVSYSDDGRVLRPFIDVFETSNVAGCEIDTAGRLVVAVQTGVGGAAANADYGVLRLLPNGLPDLSFNSTGQTRVAIDLGGAGIGNDIAAAMALDGDRVLVAGTSSMTNGGVPNGEKQTLIRLGPDRFFADGFE